MTGATDLFGNPLEEPVMDMPAAPPINDMNLIEKVLQVAENTGYVLVGPLERVYRQVAPKVIESAPRYEAEAVHQLLSVKWLTKGGTHAYTCHGYEGPGKLGFGAQGDEGQSTQVARVDPDSLFPQPKGLVMTSQSINNHNKIRFGEFEFALDQVRAAFDEVSKLGEVPEQQDGHGGPVRGLAGPQQGRRSERPPDAIRRTGRTPDGRAQARRLN